MANHSAQSTLGRKVLKRLRYHFFEGYDRARWWAWRKRWVGREWVEVNGSRMKVELNDPGISRELALYQTHEPMATALAVKFAAGCGTIVDLGSNVGYYALLFLTQVKPKPKLISIEPSTDNIRRLKMNLEANGLLESATIIRTAISDRCGEGQLNLARESNWHSLLPADERHSGSEAVSVITLDALVEQLDLARVDLVRMDIEGYESVVLGGMHKTLDTFKPKLIIELHPQLIGTRPVVDLINRLRSDHGYRIQHVVDREVDYAHMSTMAVSIDPEQLLQQNLDRRCFTVFMSP